MRFFEKSKFGPKKRGQFFLIGEDLHIVLIFNPGKRHICILGKNCQESHFLSPAKGIFAISPFIQLLIGEKASVLD